MAIVKCKECGSKISGKVKACPVCGAPQRKKNPLAWLITIVIIFWLFGNLFSGKVKHEQSEVQEKTKSDSVREMAERKTSPSPDKREQSKNCSKGSPVAGKFFVNAENVNFRTGPGTEFGRVINAISSEVIGRNDYRTLWPTMVLRGICQTDEWLQARIVEADGYSVDWGVGWVHKDFVTNAPSQERQAGLIWDIDGEDIFSKEEKNIVKKGALRVLKDEENCESITTGYRSSSRSDTYFVTCNSRNGGPAFNVWFTPKQVESNDALNVPSSYPENQSRRACENLILDSAAYPSTLDFHKFFGYATETHNNGNRTIIQEFSAKNAFNLEIQYRARCLVTPDGIVDISISEIR